MMPRRELSRRRILAAGFGLLALAWAGALGEAHLAGRATLLDRIEAPLLDLRFLIAGPRPAPGDVVIVALDDDAIREGRYPLPRTTLAELVRALSRLGAKAIALDILFIDPGPPADDEALARSLADVRGVIAGAGLFGADRSGGEDRPNDLPELARVIWPIKALGDAAAVGLVNVTTDDGGTPRHVPLLLRNGNALVPSFPLRVAARAAGAEAIIDRDRITVGAVATRTDLGLNVPLRFYGPRGTIPTVGARAVLGGEPAAAMVAGRTVVVGATALGTSDTFSTPFDPVLPGVEVMATAASHLIAGDGLVRDRAVRRIDVAAAASLALGAVLLISFIPLGTALSLTILAGSAWIVASMLAFSQGYWLSAVMPLAAVALPAALCAGARQGLDRRRAGQVAKAEEALRRFQAPALADRIADDPSFLAHPVQRDVPILFVDLSRFTRLSERLGPRRTQELLREFHAVVEDEVTRHGGLVLNFMGDGAMIAFGLPEPKADDASRALQAAMGLANRVGSWLAGHAEDLDVRVGAHHGPVVVSRLGTETHQHITATGDSVNVASRLLEVAAREGARVVVSADLLRAAGDDATPWSPGEMRSIEIRGREKPLTVALWPRDGAPSPALRKGA